MTNIYLSDIYIYPIKSLAGIRVSNWPVVKTGFKYDRKWMLIDAEQRFLSQRSLPRMALIKTALTANKLVVSAPGMENLTLELEPQTGPVIRSTIWHDQVDAIMVSDEADNWFSHFLQLACKLVYQTDRSIRPVNPNFSRPNDQTSFSDGFPFLLISESSLCTLNQAMQLDMPMIRFRPNLVISGCDSYAEDTWREITIGSLGFRLPKPCSRCSVPTIDPETAETGKEPLTTLSRLRKWDNKVYFGQNVLHDNCGILSVGDKLLINLYGPNQPPLPPF
jgi:uncharacterized protein